MPAVGPSSLADDAVNVGREAFAHPQVGEIGLVDLVFVCEFRPRADTIPNVLHGSKN